MRSIERRNAVIEIYTDPQSLAVEAADKFARLADSFVKETGLFSVALSGGSTPKAMFSILAEKPYAGRLPWRSIRFFWGDERAVQPDHADSNYRMADQTLLSKVAVPGENIYRIPAEDEDHERAAANYSATLRTFFSAEWPRFDLIFLGMGADGHTASLFPGTSALQANDRIVAANYVEKFQSHRITLTTASINNARNVIFLVAGEDKSPALKEVIDGERNPGKYPSQLIEPRDGKLLWMVDEAAAKLL
jgi:6-phosphogluconolactonase